MRIFFFTALLVLTASITQANTEKCYSLYMRENSGDPSQACVQFNPETGVASAINLLMTSRELKETLTLNANEQIVVYKGRMALHYYTLKGEGQFHSIDASQSAVTGSLTSLRVYSNIDGHLQEAVQFNYKPVPKQSCVPGRRCI